MFDGSLPGPEALTDADDAALVAAITGWTRVASAAQARALAAIAELTTRRCTPEQHPDWACDDWDAAAAEIAAALTLGHGRASAQMDLALTLRNRLPRVGALFAAGTLTAATVDTIAERTALVTDDDVLSELDTQLATEAPRWGAQSRYKLERTVDHIVERLDPAARRRSRSAARGREVTIDHHSNPHGTSAIHGRLISTDAALLDARLKTMALGVCPEDPRTLAQRRADALGALANHATHLSCRCGAPDCPSTGPDPRANNVVIHVVADATSTTAAPDPHVNGAPPHRPVTATTPLAEALSPEPEPEPQPTPRPPALILGGPLIPAPLLAELIAHGAKTRTVSPPGSDAEAGHRPRTALDEFVRLRDLSCRFPGCDRPAITTDLDHTIPWPAGPTHAGNLKNYCRKHHLLKTFWPGWTEHQHPDGTLDITTPTGHTYTTTPGATLLFPHWNATTPAPATSPAPPTAPRPGRTLMMPRRKRTRAQARHHRITTERALNDAHVAERNRPPPF